MSNDDLSLEDLTPNVLDTWEQQASDRPDRATPQTSTERQVIALARALKRLRALARAMLEASEPNVPETEGMRRAGALAAAIGYEPGPQAPLGMPPPRGNDMDRMQREVLRLGDLLRIEVEETSPAWAFSLFLFEKRDDPHRGHVLHIARDRDQALAAVAAWVHQRLEAKKVGARG